MVDRSHSNPRAQSMPDPATSSHMLRPSSSLLPKSISPLSTSDNESGTESNMLEGDERSGARTRRNGKVREEDFLRGRSYDSSGAVIDQEEGQDESARGQSRSGGQGEGQSEPPKKRKKSKMHECEVCQKKFPRYASPKFCIDHGRRVIFFFFFEMHALNVRTWVNISPYRPSGLKTHMNTHSNEKRKPSVVY